MKHLYLMCRKLNDEAMDCPVQAAPHFSLVCSYEVVEEAEQQGIPLVVGVVSIVHLVGSEGVEVAVV